MGHLTGEGIYGKTAGKQPIQRARLFLEEKMLERGENTLN